MKLSITAFDLAQRFLGVEEGGGVTNHPLIQWWYTRVNDSAEDMRGKMTDDVPWCSAFANAIAWELRLPRSKSLAARSWLTIGKPIEVGEAQPENDVVILKRVGAGQPGPTVLNAQGHVGFYAGRETRGDAGTYVQVLGGNQGDMVSLAWFPIEQVLGIRRLA